MQPQRAVFRPVVDELPFPGEQSLVFETLDGLARPETHIAGKNVHQFVLGVSCRMGFVLVLFLIETTRRHSFRACHMLRHSGMRRQAQARNPYSRSWL
jgi:hypothetical protein